MRHSKATLSALAVATALIVMPLSAPVALSANAGQASAARPIVGAVVARGAKDPDGACFFDGGTAQELEFGRWVILRVSSDCVVTVASTWIGSLSEGPSALTGPIVADLGDIAPASGAEVVSIATSCKTVKQHFFTYGFGGAAFDKLTHVWSSLTYCYTGFEVWGTSTAGSACAGTNEPSWTWMNDLCIYSSQSLGESDSSVWSTVRGDFHCSPDASFPCNLSDPDGYHHRLFARVAGYPSGHSGCTHSWDGHIVLGPEVEIVSGCT
ncbi:MAG TPA: hypothetical protein VKC59_04255 [Candidatus Limnocylindrales bacterium]|nr:hypothetical protein [Candidatus Limnocylindrales bacterium]